MGEAPGATRSGPREEVTDAAWRPTRASAKARAAAIVAPVLVAGLVFALGGLGGRPTTSLPYPEELTAPTVGWFFDNVMPALWVVLAIGLLLQALKRGRLSVIAVAFFSTTTMFWQEWLADWGPALVYNRDLRLFHGWTSTNHQTFYKPVGVFFGYGLFFAAGTLAMLTLVPPVMRRLPDVNRKLLTAAIAVVVFWVFDVVAEGAMTAVGWYSYTSPVGPDIVLHGKMSLVFPALPFLLFAVAQSLLLFSRDEDGLSWPERAAGAARLPAGLARELARVAGWALTLNLVLFLTQPVALWLIRITFLSPSRYVP
jgi:hypothetical protein